MLTLRRPGRYGLDITGRLVATTPTLIRRPGMKPGEMLCWTVMVNGAPSRLPVWPGETMKGAMRAAAFVVMAEAAVRAGVGLSALTLERLYTQTKGGLEFTGERGDLGSDDALRAAEPILSLFGAASPRLEGKVSVLPAEAEPALGGAFPTMDLPGGVRRDPLLASPDLGAALSDATKAEWAERMGGVAAASRKRNDAKARREAALRTLIRARNTEGADVAKHQKEFDDAEKALAALKDDPEALNSLQRPLDPVPAIPAGTVYRHTIKAVDMTLQEVGFLLAVLCAMPTLETGLRIGGGRTAGYGYYTGEYTVTAPADAAGRRWRWRNTPVATIALPGDGAAGTVTASGEGAGLIADAFAAWEAAEDDFAAIFSTFAPAA